VIEDKGSGMSLIQDLKRENIRAVKMKPEVDKVIRMNAQTARIEAGNVFLPLRAGWLDEFGRSSGHSRRAATVIRPTGSRRLWTVPSTRAAVRFLGDLSRGLAYNVTSVRTQRKCFAAVPENYWNHVGFQGFAVTRLSAGKAWLTRRMSNKTRNRHAEL
jgi:hypothetical protein